MIGVTALRCSASNRTLIITGGKAPAEDAKPIFCGGSSFVSASDRGDGFLVTVRSESAAAFLDADFRESTTGSSRMKSLA